MDLFAGAGGLSLGFQLAGGTPIYALEVDKWAATTFRYNHPDVPVDERDIETITQKEIEDLRELEPDVIVGGPPCQGFSHSNVANKDRKDPRNSLFQSFLKYVDILRPQFAVIENVPGLLTSKTESGVPVVKVIADSFRLIGYTCDWRTLEAANFGVPQRRARLFIIAFPSETKTSFRWPTPTHQAPTLEVPGLFDASSMKTWVTLRHAISDLPECLPGNAIGNAAYRHPPLNSFQAEMRQGAPSEIRNHEPMRHTARIVERFSQIRVGQSEADAMGHHIPRRRGAPDVASDKSYSQNSRRQNPDTPCNTIVASSHTNFIHPTLDRNFTVRELMRIQSFPDYYLMCGKRAVLSKKLSLKKGYFEDVYLDQRMQVGNAVPPLLGRAVAEAICAALKNVKASSLAA